MVKNISKWYILNDSTVIHAIINWDEYILSVFKLNLFFIAKLHGCNIEWKEMWKVDNKKDNNSGKKTALKSYFGAYIFVVCLDKVFLPWLYYNFLNVNVCRYLRCLNETILNNILSYIHVSKYCFNITCTLNYSICIYIDTTKAKHTCRNPTFSRFCGLNYQ